MHNIKTVFYHWLLIMLKKFKSFLIAVLALVAVFFGVLFFISNSQQMITVDLLAFSFPELSAAVVMGVFLVLGFVLGLLASSAIFLKMRAQLLLSERKLKSAQKA